MPNRKNIPAFSPFLYHYRNRVERFFNKLKHFGAVATHHDKREDNWTPQSNSPQSGLKVFLVLAESDCITPSMQIIAFQNPRNPITILVLSNAFV